MFDKSLLAICTLSPALQLHRVVGCPRHRADTSSAVAVTAAGHSQNNLSGNAPRVLCDTGRLYVAWSTTSCCSPSSRTHPQRYQTSRGLHSLLAVCLLHLPTCHCSQHYHSFADTTDWGFFWLGLIFPLAWLIGFFRPLFRHPHFPQRQNFIGWIGNVVGKYHSGQLVPFQLHVSPKHCLKVCCR